MTDVGRSGLHTSLNPGSKIISEAEVEQVLSRRVCLCGRQWLWEGERSGGAVASVRSR